MAKLLNYLYNTNMDYFDDLSFTAFDHVPRCSVWIDREFPEFYALNFACDGKIQWGTSDAPPVTLSAPVAWWTWPGPRFQYGCHPGESWNHYYVTFRGPRAERIFTRGLVPSVPNAGPYQAIADAEAYRAAWERLFALIALGGRQANGAAVHCLEGLFLCLHQVEALQPYSPHQAAVDSLAEAIRRDLKRQWDWREEAQKQGISEAHLRRLFRDRLHAPPHQYLLRARLEAAARLLRSTAVPITQIAEAVGIPDIYHFSKCFKACYHLAPRPYRQQTRLFYDPSTNIADTNFSKPGESDMNGG